MCAPLDLLEAKEKGQVAISRAEEKRNTTVTPVRLQTFHEKRQKPVKSLKVNIYQKARNFVRCLHFLRDIESESFSCEWTKYYSSLVESDDQGYLMKKGNKADYGVAMKNQRGDSWVKEDHFPNTGGNVVLLVDAMAFILRQQDAGFKNFLNMATRYLHKLLMSRPPGCNMVNLVGDRHDVQ